MQHFWAAKDVLLTLVTPQTGAQASANSSSGRLALHAPLAASVSKDRTDEEVEEGAVVAMAHAAVDPGAVMVHAQHAAPAKPTVVSARRLVPLALGAEARFPALRTHSTQCLDVLEKFWCLSPEA